MPARRSAMGPRRGRRDAHARQRGLHGGVHRLPRGGARRGSVAALGVLLLCYPLVVIPAGYFRRSVNAPRVRAFVDDAKPPGGELVAAQWSRDGGAESILTRVQGEFRDPSVRVVISA